MGNKWQQTHAKNDKRKRLLPQDMPQKKLRTRKTLWTPRLFSIGPTRAFFLLLLFFTGFASPVFAINFNAYWSYQQAGGEERETFTQFQQRYSLGIGQALTYRPSHAISASAAVGYTRTQSDAGNGMLSTNNLNPSARLSLRNDIFLAQLSGSTSIRSNDTRDSSDSSWAATLASQWNIPLWPSLSFNYTEYTEPIPSISLFVTSGKKEKSTNINLNWDLLLATFSYQFSNSIADDPVGNSLAESDSHFARIETEGNFWDKRLIFNFAQQFRYSIEDVSIEGADGFFNFLLDGEVLSKIDQVGDADPSAPSPPSIPNPDTQIYYEDPASPLPQEVISGNNRIHLRFITDGGFDEKISLLSLTLSDSVSALQAEDLQWELYTRNVDDSWGLVPGVLLGKPSNVIENSIDIDMPANFEASEIIIIATNNTSSSLIFTALRAFNQITQNSKSSLTSYLTNFSLGYRITKNLRAAVNMTLEQAEFDSDGLTVESNRRTVSGNLRWTPLPFVSPSLGFSESRDEFTGQPENINRSYSLTVSTRPLKSMTASFGITNTERYSGEEKYFASTRYNLSTKASIYPDLTATWSLSYGETDALQNDGLVRKDKRLSSGLSLIAQLSKYLTADLITNYSNFKNETDNNQNGSAQFNLKYRPSSLLTVRGGYKTYLLDSNTTDAFDLNMYLQLLNTDKTRLTLTATHTQASTTSDIFSLVGSWDISRKLSLVTQGSLRLAELNSYNFRVNISLRF